MSNFWAIFWKSGSFEQLFWKFWATFQEISSNLWTGTRTTPVTFETSQEPYMKYQKQELSRVEDVCPDGAKSKQYQAGDV